MAEITKIEWADSTANLWIGCTKVSPACYNCYAEADFDHRKHRVEWGPHGDRSYCKAGWALLRKLQRDATAFEAEHGRKRLVFINSLSDFFDNHRSIVWRDAAWQAFRECPDLIIMLLTKRPQNIIKMLPNDWGDGYPNVWLGTTVENQTEAERRIPHLLGTPAAVRFLSCEPLLGPVDLTRLDDGDRDGSHLYFDALTGLASDGDGIITGIFGQPNPKIDWVIVGGESGPNARPTHPAWARSLRDQCWIASVPFHFKQWGEWADARQFEGCGLDLNRNAYDAATDTIRIGKKAAGRLLDDVEHNGVAG